MKSVRLTERQQKVAELVCKGLTNPEIAKILDISIGTVKNHLWVTFTKYGVKNRTQFTLKYLKESH